MSGPLISSVIYPENPLPLIFDSPHSGRTYPADFRFACPLDILQKAEDNFVDDLFAAAPRHGGTLLCALFPRTYIDVNRAEDDLDPDLLAPGFAAGWPYPLNPTARSHAGIGLIRRVLKPGIAVYDRKLDAAEVRHRLDQYYIPYHRTLENLIDDAHYRFGQCWHINCHSMPQNPASARGTTPGALHVLPDFVLGDRDGTTCDPNFTRALRDFLKSLGYRVAINNPYRGVELVRRYGAPATGRHSLQIEINKRLYWDEIDNEKNKNYNALKADIDKMIEFCAAYVAGNLAAMAAD